MTDSHDTRALAIIPRTIDEVTDLAERLSKSSLLPKSMQGKMPDVLVTILAGQEMGLSPMASLRNFHVIEGKPVLSADGMVALVLGSGKAAYFRRIQDSDTAVTYETLRVGDDKPRSCTWTKDMIKIAGLNTKDNHRLYPRAMLAARAKAELARDVFPDVLAGCYTTEEVGDWERPAPADVQDAEIVSEDPPPELDAIEAAETTEALKALAPSLAKLSSAHKAIATERYKARLKTLREAEKTTEGAA